MADFTAAPSARSTPELRERPNFIVFVLDDVEAWDFTPYNQHPLSALQRTGFSSKAGRP